MTPEERKEYRRLVSRRSYEKNLTKIQKKREANREAAKEYAQKYREKNPERTRESKAASYVKHRETASKYRAANARTIRSQKAVWHSKTWPQRKAAVIAKHSEWLKNSQWHKRRYDSDVGYRIKMALRARLRGALNRRSTGGRAFGLLGCTAQQLRDHIESQFQKGMTWSNWSLRGWHVDHIKPLAAFDLTEPAQMAEACHYTNLQPLWAIDNYRKGAKTA